MTSEKATDCNSFRAVLPCQVRVIAKTHPLFGQLLLASGFSRRGGVLSLVVELADGSPATIRVDATDALGGVETGGPAVVVDAEGLRQLHRLVARMRAAGDMPVSSRTAGTHGGEAGR